VNTLSQYNENVVVTRGGSTFLFNNKLKLIALGLGIRYFSIRVKEIADRSLEFCYHRTSSSIFNAGFCKANTLELEKPFGK
jgi:hypothetical protein